eukprot:3603490-Pyramimonas_sp.AAC.1
MIGPLIYCYLGNNDAARRLLQVFQKVQKVFNRTQSVQRVFTRTPSGLIHRAEPVTRPPGDDLIIHEMSSHGGTVTQQQRSQVSQRFGINWQLDEEEGEESRPTRTSNQYKSENSEMQSNSALKAHKTALSSVRADFHYHWFCSRFVDAQLECKFLRSLRRFQYRCFHEHLVMSSAALSVFYALVLALVLTHADPALTRVRYSSLSPPAIGARYGYILSLLLRLVPATGIFSLLLRLVPATGIFTLSCCDWCPLRVYSLSPAAIGARYGYILSLLLRLVPATGIFSLSCCDWCPLRV